MHSTLTFAVRHDGTIIYGVIQHLIYMYMLIWAFILCILDFIENNEEEKEWTLILFYVKLKACYKI